MEKSKKRKLEVCFEPPSEFCKTKRQKQQNLETEYIVVKIEPIEVDFVEVSNANSPNEEMSRNKCPKCSISYKSKASMKNHIQVCRSEEHKQVFHIFLHLLIFQLYLPKVINIKMGG